VVLSTVGEQLLALQEVLAGSLLLLEIVAWAAVTNQSNRHADELLRILRLHIGKKKINLVNMQSIKNKIVRLLPSSLAVNLEDMAMPDFDGQQNVQFAYVDPYLAGVVGLLQAPASKGSGVVWSKEPQPGYMRQLDDAEMLGPFKSSKWWREAQEEKPPDSYLVAVTVSGDEFQILKRMGSHAISITIANFEESCRSTDFVRVVAEIPELNIKKGCYGSKEGFARRKRMLWQQCFAFIIRKIREGNVKSPWVEFPDGIRRKIWCKVGVIAVDYKEAVALAGVHAYMPLKSPLSAPGYQWLAKQTGQSWQLSSASNIIVDSDDDSDDGRLELLQPIEAKGAQPRKWRASDLDSLGYLSHGSLHARSAQEVKQVCEEFWEHSNTGSGKIDSLSRSAKYGGSEGINFSKYKEFLQKYGLYPDYNPLWDIHGEKSFPYAQILADWLHQMYLGLCKQHSERGIGGLYFTVEDSIGRLWQRIKEGLYQIDGADDTVFTDSQREDATRKAVKALTQTIQGRSVAVTLSHRGHYMIMKLDDWWKEVREVKVKGQKAGKPVSWGPVTGEEVWCTYVDLPVLFDGACDDDGLGVLAICKALVSIAAARKAPKKGRGAAGQKVAPAPGGAGQPSWESRATEIVESIVRKEFVAIIQESNQQLVRDVLQVLDWAHLASAPYFTQQDLQDMHKRGFDVMGMLWLHYGFKTPKWFMIFGLSQERESHGSHLAGNTSGFELSLKGLKDVNTNQHSGVQESVQRIKSFTLAKHLQMLTITAQQVAIDDPESGWLHGRDVESCDSDSDGSSLAEDSDGDELAHARRSSKPKSALSQPQSRADSGLNRRVSRGAFPTLASVFLQHWFTCKLKERTMLKVAGPQARPCSRGQDVCFVMNRLVQIQSLASGPSASAAAGCIDLATLVQELPAMQYIPQCLLHCLAQQQHVQLSQLIRRTNGGSWVGGHQEVTRKFFENHNHLVPIMQGGLHDVCLYTRMTISVKDKQPLALARRQWTTLGVQPFASAASSSGGKGGAPRRRLGATVTPTIVFMAPGADTARGLGEIDLRDVAQWDGRVRYGRLLTLFRTNMRHSIVAGAAGTQQALQDYALVREIYKWSNGDTSTICSGQQLVVPPDDCTAALRVIPLDHVLAKVPLVSHPRWAHVCTIAWLALAWLADSAPLPLHMLRAAESPHPPGLPTSTRRRPAQWGPHCGLQHALYLRPPHHGPDPVRC
jgi:hypothetical protein